MTALCLCVSFILHDLNLFLFFILVNLGFERIKGGTLKALLAVQFLFVLIYCYDIGQIDVANVKT